jgi:hypothetical protein
MPSVYWRPEPEQRQTAQQAKAATLVAPCGTDSATGNVGDRAPVDDAEPARAGAGGSTAGSATSTRRRDSKPPHPSTRSVASQSCMAASHSMLKRPTRGARRPRLPAGMARGRSVGCVVSTRGLPDPTLVWALRSQGTGGVWRRRRKSQALRGSTSIRSRPARSSRRSLHPPLMRRRHPLRRHTRRRQSQVPTRRTVRSTCTATPRR